MKYLLNPIVLLKHYLAAQAIAPAPKLFRMHKQPLQTDASVRMHNQVSAEGSAVVLDLDKPLITSAHLANTLPPSPVAAALNKQTQSYSQSQHTKMCPYAQQVYQKALAPSKADLAGKSVPDFHLKQPERAAVQKSSLSIAPSFPQRP